MSLRKKVLIVASALVVAFAACCSWMVFETRSAMEDVEAVAYGEPNRQQEVPEALRFFAPQQTASGYSWTYARIDRCFVWAIGDEGTMWAYCEARQVMPDGTENVQPDFISLSIEKRDGRWEVASLHGEL